jgi:D-glycero-alpha-D-manno-heptose 1-phosphate guanylyltransferase
MIFEAIILAGGKGTRLQSVVSEVPKPMAPIGDKPFLYYQMLYLASRGVNRFILSVGYKSETITSYFGDEFNGLPIVYVFEETPLGTGGGVRLAINACQSENPFVVNGDTFFEFEHSKLLYVHLNSKALLTFSVKEIENDGRYGGMQIADDASVKGFTAKDITGKTYINAGVYLINKERFLSQTSEGRFSLEDEFLAPKVSENYFFACPFNTSHFIDIGIPTDYERGQTLIPVWSAVKKKIFDTVFLDRDGVLNKKIDDGYVTKPSELEILPGVSEQLAKWNTEGKELFIVTNQRGVGREIMSIEDLHLVHFTLLKELERSEVNIRDIKFCTDIDSSSFRRKPNPGMLLELFEEFPHLKKESTLFIGDSESDMKAGKSGEVSTCFITNQKGFTFDILTVSDFIITDIQSVVII